tara:strand:+ start:7256 stop:7669 length:414 start_codon:yes stop_codon:yes gene_type:complete
MRPLILAALCAILPFAAAAQAFRAENRLTVVPLNANDFEVIEGLGAGPRGIWCAASDFATSRLGRPGTSRIYLKTPRSPSLNMAGRKGVVFTTDPARLGVEPSRSYFLSVRKVGLSLPVAHAYLFCSDYLERSVRFR